MMTKKPVRASFAWAATIGLLLLSAPQVRAGGLARPNVGGPRAIALGGAFAAIADDPTALHFNPAGLALLTKSSVYAAGEFIYMPRYYEPDLAACTENPDSPLCQRQTASSSFSALPAFGFASRLRKEGIPSRLAFGVGFWNTYGGQIDYRGNECETCGPGGTDNRISGTILQSQDAVLELVPGVGYQVNDVLAVGAAIRIGFGLFSSVVYNRPKPAEMSAFGLGAGATLGVMVTPSKKINIAGYYRTPLRVTTSGSAKVWTNPSTPTNWDLELTQRWPQEMGGAIALHPMDRLTLAGQFNWHGWAINNVLDPQFAGNPSLTQQSEIKLDWNNSWSVHSGVEYRINETVAVQAGYSFDTEAVPHKTMERQFIDGPKHMVALGCNYLIAGSWRVDMAFESKLPEPVLIEDNSAEYTDWGTYPEVAGKNYAPGEQDTNLISFELGLQYLY